MIATLTIRHFSSAGSARDGESCLYTMHSTLTLASTLIWILFWCRVSACKLTFWNRLLGIRSYYCNSKSSPELEKRPTKTDTTTRVCILPPATSCFMLCIYDVRVVCISMCTIHTIRICIVPKDSVCRNSTS